MSCEFGQDIEVEESLREGFDILRYEHGVHTFYHYEFI